MLGVKRKRRRAQEALQVKPVAQMTVRQHAVYQMCALTQKLIAHRNSNALSMSYIPGLHQFFV
jgi:hypothetical protein